MSAGGFSLCALKAIATTAGGGQPVLWRATKQFANSFNINAGWSFGGGSWGQAIPANTPFSEVLIHQAPLQLSQSVAKVNASLR